MKININYYDHCIQNEQIQIQEQSTVGDLISKLKNQNEIEESIALYADPHKSDILKWNQLINHQEVYCFQSPIQFIQSHPTRISKLVFYQFKNQFLQRTKFSLHYSCLSQIKQIDNQFDYYVRIVFYKEISAFVDLLQMPIEMHFKTCTFTPYNDLPFRDLFSSDIKLYLDLRYSQISYQINLIQLLMEQKKGKVEIKVNSSWIKQKQKYQLSDRVTIISYPYQQIDIIENQYKSIDYFKQRLQLENNLASFQQLKSTKLRIEYFHPVFDFDQSNIIHLILDFSQIRVDNIDLSLLFDKIKKSQTLSKLQLILGQLWINIYKFTYDIYFHNLEDYYLDIGQIHLYSIYHISNQTFDISSIFNIMMMSTKLKKFTIVMAQFQSKKNLNWQQIHLDCPQTLEEISLNIPSSGQILRVLDLKSILNKLQRFHLRIMGGTLSDIIVSNFIQYISPCKQFQELDLNFMNLSLASQYDFLSLYNALNSNQSLKFLRINLSRNLLKDSFIIQTLLKQTKHVKHVIINLNKNKFTIELALFIFKFLQNEKNSNNLLELYLSELYLNLSVLQLFTCNFCYPLVRIHLCQPISLSRKIKLNQNTSMILNQLLTQYRSYSKVIASKFQLQNEQEYSIITKKLLYNQIHNQLDELIYK